MTYQTAMRRIAVFVLILIATTPLLAAVFDPCTAYPWNPVIIAGDGEPATLLFIDRAVPAAYDPPTVEIFGREIRVTQQQSEAAAPRGPCNVAAAALVFPPELPPGDFHVTWIYASGDAWRPVAEWSISIGVTPALTVVPAHPDASTPVSLIGSGRFSPSFDPSFATRSGSKILARESVAASAVGIYPNGPRRVALGLLPPGTYEAVWSMQFPALAPTRIETRRLTFTVDPAPRRRSTGGGATTVIEQPCVIPVRRVLIEPPLRASDDPAIWLHQGSTDVGEVVAFERPEVAFDGMSFHVTQQAKPASTGDPCTSWRINLRQPLLDGTTYPLTWDTVVARNDGTRVPHRWESSLPYNTVTASLDIVPGTFSPGSPVIVSVMLSGPGDDGTALARPWVHVDGTSVFIDVEAVFEHHTSALAVLPPLAAGTYDVTITTHVGKASLHRTHTTLVIPPAGK